MPMVSRLRAHRLRRPPPVFRSAGDQDQRDGGAVDQRVADGARERPVQGRVAAVADDQEVRAAFLGQADESLLRAPYPRPFYPSSVAVLAGSSRQAKKA